ncbi:TetR family transcriptional regulator [Amycolatopsis jiangsuensis]|uniref:AcrR family transcriptional regulator n=1 Tax=Amycolatopsis jiangsuensis TaxID=1181879 RepID=A0A840J565_9PSEU|nr:TetR family transcriptional regulator [Amycolatopsis jiangsuensis]MBB4688548.1 AcrR family transcriptional regulator [Amycolatopsis jiangsuensis]
MARWEPNARERLEHSSLELFTERGYDQTTVAEIAERAGLTKRTFFRYFEDKREVLFGGQELLDRLFTEGITGAPEAATPLTAVGGGLNTVAAVFDAQRWKLARKRQVIVAGHRDLRERELLKGTRLVESMRVALRARGVPDTTAKLASTVGSLAFGAAFERWIEDESADFAALAGHALDELRKSAGELG